MKREIELSVVIPCLNESETIQICLEKIFKVFNKEKIIGEVIVVDNGCTDDSINIAKKYSTRIIREKKKGYGFALRKGIESAKGKYVLFADCDDSYNFLDIKRFLNYLRSGYDLVQGCRLPSGGGKILHGAMPLTHRYFGNPFFSFLVRFLYSAPYFDVYCGMRAFSKNFFLKLKHYCGGMEFAIENLLKFSIAKAKIKQIPITLHKDGRKLNKSHLRTFQDGWKTLKLLLICSPKWLYFLPAMTFLFFGIENIFSLYRKNFSDIDLVREITVSSIFFILFMQVFMFGIFSSLKAHNLGFSNLNKFVILFFSIFKIRHALILSFFLICLSIFKIYFNQFVIINALLDKVISYFVFCSSVLLVFNSLLISFLEFDKNE